MAPLGEGVEMKHEEELRALLGVQLGRDDHDLVVGGQLNFSPRNFSGSIDEIRIWDIARSTSDIENNYSTHLNGSEEGLAFYLNFEGEEPYVDKASFLEAIINGNVTFNFVAVKSVIVVEPIVPPVITSPLIASFGKVIALALIALAVN